MANKWQFSFSFDGFHGNNVDRYLWLFNGHEMLVWLPKRNEQGRERDSLPRWIIVVHYGELLHFLFLAFYEK
jgi:hypothetical protein